MNTAKQAADTGRAGRKRARQTAAVVVAAVEPIFVDLPTAAALFSLSEATFQRMVVAGEMPPPRDLTPGRVGYLLTELREHASRRPVSKKLPPENTGGRRKQETSHA